MHPEYDQTIPQWFVTIIKNNKVVRYFAASHEHGFYSKIAMDLARDSHKTNALPEGEYLLVVNQIGSPLTTGKVRLAHSYVGTFTIEAPPAPESLFIPNPDNPTR